MKKRFILGLFLCLFLFTIVSVSAFSFSGFYDKYLNFNHNSGDYITGNAIQSYYSDSCFYDGVCDEYGDECDYDGYCYYDDGSDIGYDSYSSSNYYDNSNQEENFVEDYNTESQCPEGYELDSQGECLPLDYSQNQDYYDEASNLMDENLNPCDSADCGFGECQTINNNDYYCLCDAGWEGDNCYDQTFYWIESSGDGNLQVVSGINPPFWVTSYDNYENALNDLNNQGISTNEVTGENFNLVNIQQITDEVNSAIDAADNTIYSAQNAIDYQDTEVCISEYSNLLSIKSQLSQSIQDANDFASSTNDYYNYWDAVDLADSATSKLDEVSNVAENTLSCSGMSSDEEIQSEFDTAFSGLFGTPSFESEETSVAGSEGNDKITTTPKAGNYSLGSFNLDVDVRSSFVKGIPFVDDRENFGTLNFGITPKIKINDNGEAIGGEITGYLNFGGLYWRVLDTMKDDIKSDEKNNIVQDGIYKKFMIDSVNGKVDLGKAIFEDFLGDQKGDTNGRGEIISVQREDGNIDIIMKRNYLQGDNKINKDKLLATISPESIAGFAQGIGDLMARVEKNPGLNPSRTWTQYPDKKYCGVTKDFKEECQFTETKTSSGQSIQSYFVNVKDPGKTVNKVGYKNIQYTLPTVSLKSISAKKATSQPTK